ncbi:biotin/lipoyl-containing protein [Diaphorobacter caeni]|uniref:biotin/lipoyl-containing protein n=1 Tax=Diaphorobacter caeni TaxID=2784387 RepID=UPI00188E70EE|nr:biotin/lipoyl-containing protein [Diaphorobacter caeni]MBF5007210.1 hypothetical protein [Diaphorobacter caeni]
MNPADILQIAQQLRQSGMQAIEIRDAATRLRIVTRAAGGGQFAACDPTASITSANETPDGDVVVRSGALGVVRLRHPAQAGAAALEAGAQVQEGAAALYLESRGLLKSIDSPVSGVVGDLLVAEGDKVDFGKPVFTVRARA